MVVVPDKGASLPDDDGLGIVLLPVVQRLVTLAQGQLPTLTAVIVVEDGTHIVGQLSPASK